MENRAYYTFYGQYAHSVFRDEKTGKGTFFLETIQYPVSDTYITRKTVKRDEITQKDVVWYEILCNSLGCPMPFYEKDTPIKVTGYFDKPSDKYGYELKVTEIEVSSNSDEASIRYLKHYTSAKAATQLVSTYGYQIFDFAETEEAPELVQKVTDLTGAEAMKLINEIRRTVAERHLFEFLSKLNIPFPYCIKAVKVYGQQAETYLRQNPFEIGERIGLPYIHCRNIAEAVNVPASDEELVRAAAAETIRQISAGGHTYTDIETFRRKFERLAGKDTGSLTQAFPFVKDFVGLNMKKSKPEVFALSLERAERRIAYNLIRIANNTPDEEFDEDIIGYAENACQMPYGKQQRGAFRQVLSGKGVKILTGGPGTGKTTTLKGILLCYLRMHPKRRIALCAPTGRAAQKMTESTGFPASTIHKLIGFCPYNTQQAQKNSANPLEVDLLVVDEGSMLETYLFDMLLEAVKTGTKLLIMGDPDQLEAVGPGAILYDIMNTRTDLFVQTHLTEVFRQKGGSPIIENASRINKGSTELVQHKDFFMINVKSSEEALEVVKQIVRDYHDKCDPFKVQVLSPARQGVAGVLNLNNELQKVINPGMLPNGRKAKDIVYGNTRYRVGDKIMMMRNNYDEAYGYCNGDIGVIKAVFDGVARVEIQGREMDITRSMLDEMALSYAMTIHKSQGSDFPIVIVVLPKEPENMLVRNLLYTGITRAKNQVFVINENGAVERAIRRGKIGGRNTRLAGYIQQVLDET